MINERKDEAIRQLLNISSAKKSPTDTELASGGSQSNRYRQKRNSSETTPESLISSSQIQGAGKHFEHEMRGVATDHIPFSLITTTNGSNNNETDLVALQGSAMARANAQKNIKPERMHRSTMQDHNRQAKGLDIKLEPMIEFLNDGQSALEADGKVCQLIESGVHAIIGPTDGASIQHVQSICDNLEIPYFELRPFLGGTLVAPVSSVTFVPSVIAGTQPTLGATLGRLTGAFPSSETVHSNANTWNEDPLVRRRQQQKPELVAKRRPLDDDDDHSGNLKPPSVLGTKGLPISDKLDVGNPPSVEGDFNDMDSVIVVSTERALEQTIANITASSPPTTHTGPGHGVSANIDNDDVNGPRSQSIPYSTRESLAQSRTNNNNNFASLANNKLEDLTLNLYPPSHLLTSAYIDLIYALNWTSFAIVYEDGSSMIKLQDLFRESSGTWSSKWAIKLFRYDSNLIEMEGQQRQQNLPQNSNKFYKNNNNNSTNYNQNNERNQVSNLKNSNVAPPGAGTITHSLGERNALPLLRNITAVQQHNDESFSQFSIKSSNAIENLFQNSDNLANIEIIKKHDTNDNLPINDAPNQSKLNKKKQQSDNTYRDIFWRLKLSGEHNILLDVKTENLYEALKQAQQVGCMTEEYSYLITSLDLQTLDLEDFKYSRTKITGFSIIQVAKQQQQPILKQTTNGQGTIGPKLLNLQQSIVSSGPVFGEKYLENLGILHVIQGDNNVESKSRSSKNTGKGTDNNQRSTNGKQRKTSTNINEHNNKPNPTILNDRSWSSLATEAAYNDVSRREMLQSSPASLGLLPTVDRNNEQRLFDFFLQQQEQNLSRIRLSTASAILHDSLILYALGLNELDPNGKFLGNPQIIACSLDSQPWSHGSSMVNYMRQISFTGLTGSVSFDQRGLRTNFKLDVMGMAPNIGLVKVGEWHSKHVADSKNKYYNLNQAPTNGDKSNDENKSYDELSIRYGLELERYTKMIGSGQKVEVPYTKRVSPNGALLVNEIIFERLYRDQADQIDTLIVTSKLSQPYFMLKETPSKLDGNDQYEGYAVDLIHELSKLVNFKYKWREVADKKYGSKEILPNGTEVWNGMIGEIVRGQADLAIVDLTITAQREEAVDFTLPFMNTGISILFKKPTTKVTTLFSFLSPFSSDVWAYVLAAYCGISAILFLVGHLSPYEWADPHPCRHLSGNDETVLKNQFSLLNSFWFTIGSLMQQGSDLTPRSMSTRTIAGIWYFFTLIMISSYTANLAAFLTVEKVVYPIENVRDLSNQQEIKYGCVESGSTCLFFHDSQIDTYKKINETMRQFKTYVRSNDEGQKRVGEGKFAFFMESTTIEYIIERNCNLTQIGGLIDSKGYGLATSKKSRYKRPYRTLLNEGILHLQETGMLHMLKNRWWKERRGGGTCTDDGKGGGVTELSLANVGGVFVVLLGGLGISFLVAIAEFMWRARRSGSSRDRMCEEMMNDLKFALACKSSTKPNNRSNGRGSRRGMHHQESILSQYEHFDPALIQAQVNSPQFNAKECDPILLHAMLTMLMQQQQVGGQSASLPLSSIEAEKQHTLANNLIRQHQYRNEPIRADRFNRAPFQRNATVDERFINELKNGPETQQTLGWTHSRRVNSGRRRTLHAQQTIDMTDDHFPNFLDNQLN